MFPRRTGPYRQFAATRNLARYRGKAGTSRRPAVLWVKPEDPNDLPFSDRKHLGLSGPVAAWNEWERRCRLR